VIVVSDTTPLNYLVLIGQIELLPRLYRRVVVPQAVVDELQHILAPQAVRTWMENPPTWLEVRNVDVTRASRTLLDPGELAALMLAEELHADLVLMDERNGRDEAMRRNLRVVGTLAVLADAASQELIDLPQVLEQLQKTNFFVSQRVLHSLLNRFNKPKP